MTKIDEVKAIDRNTISLNSLDNMSVSSNVPVSARIELILKNIMKIIDDEHFHERLRSIKKKYHYKDSQYNLKDVHLKHTFTGISRNIWKGDFMKGISYLGALAPSYNSWIGSAGSSAEASKQSELITHSSASKIIETEERRHLEEVNKMNKFSEEVGQLLSSFTQSKFNALTSALDS